MYKKIMVQLDGSELAECVLPHVETVIKGCDSPQLLFVQAVEPITIPYGIEASKFTSVEQLKTFETKNKSNAEKYLMKIVDHFTKFGVQVKAEVIFGKAAVALSDFANKNDVDLVVMATHGHSGINRWVLGSVADYLIHSLSVPVLIVRDFKM
jgi:nucleotide-binding universal stress UspA family protein